MGIIELHSWSGAPAHVDQPDRFASISTLILRCLGGNG